MSYITGAIYPSSDRPQLGATEEETLRAYADKNTAVALGYANPDIHELHALQKTFNLHELAIEDAGRGHQRAKLERYGDSLFTVIRPAIYLDKEEEVRLSELHLFTGPRYTLALVRDEQRSNQRINDQFNLLYATPDASPARLLHRILDSTVDGYAPVLDGLENDSDEIEDILFSHSERRDANSLARRIYELLNQVIDFQRACRPLESMIGRIIEGMRTGALDPSPYPGVSDEEKNEEAVELARQFRNVLDHVTQTKERLEDLRSSLENALRVHDTLLGQQQNDDTKRISAYAALLMVPTIVGSVYGMNFEVMPELKWEFGYPAALLLMLVSCLLLYWFFKKNKWL